MPPPEPETIFKNRIVQKGLFNLKVLNKNITEWFSNKKYSFQEKTNSSKAKDRGHEVRVDFSAEKKVDNYAKYIINIEILATELEKVRLEDKSLDKGNVEIRLNANLQLDYKNRFGDKPFHRFLRGLYHRYFKGEIKHYEDQSEEEGKDLFDTIKESLNLLT